MRCFAIDLIKALQKQIDSCKEMREYSCGVFVKSQQHADIVMAVISNIIEVSNREVMLKNDMIPEVKWRNGSILKIIVVNNHCARGERFLDVIIDNDLDLDVIDCVIMPSLIATKNFRLGKEEEYISDKPIKDSVFFVGIDEDDIEKSKMYFHMEEDMYEKLCESVNIAIESESELIEVKNKNEFENEYECMFNTKMTDVFGYEGAYITKELNNDKVLIYLATGIPKENITYETEFVNKTKETYLNIKGDVEVIDLGFKNDINIHLRIDTNIYDGYEVHIKNGLIAVVLHEIKNEAPVLKDYGRA